MELLCFERVSAEGLISRNRILSPPRLPFRHSGSLRFYTTRAACQRLARGRLSDYTSRYAACSGQHLVGGRKSVFKLSGVKTPEEQRTFMSRLKPRPTNLLGSFNTLPGRYSFGRAPSRALTRCA